MTSVTDALGWLAGAFYVIVALSIVYLFFFKIVPLVLGKITWDLWSLVRAILVLAALAFLLGCVAIFTADWIFSQVLDTLPRTRMAREVDRVTGSLVRLSVDAPYNTSTAGAAPGGLPFFNAPAAGAAPGGLPAANPFPGSTVEPGVGPAAGVARPLRQNALELWATLVQSKYNASGKLSDNMLVMNKRDIPQGVVCDVAAAANGYWPKRFEEWRLVCSQDNFRSSIVLQVNGTAARGLTGGSYYGLENPFTVYGTGLWPDNAYDTLPTPQSTPESVPADGQATPQGGPVLQETPNPARVHVVRPGESLALIAKRYSVPVARLVAANEIQYPQLQADPNVIVVGWELSIPD